jgi:hypothetical protein
MLNYVIKENIFKKAILCLYLCRNNCKTTIQSTTKRYKLLEQRKKYILDLFSIWLSEDNLWKAKGKTREQLFKEFGNELEPIACISPGYLKYLGIDINDNRVYSGKGYFIDHVVNHHPEVPISDYKNIQDILSNPDDVFLDDSKKQKTLVFVKQYKSIGTVIVGADKAGGDRLIFYKSFFNQRKNSYAKYKSIGANLSLVGGHSTISHSGKPEPASALSGRNDDTKVENISKPPK